MPNIENLISNAERTPEQRQEFAKKAGIASGAARRRKALFRKLGYTGIESFDNLSEIQQRAKEAGNFNAELKAEELKGKLAGLYVEKVASTDSLGNDLQIPLVSNKELLDIMERRHRNDRKRSQESSD